LLKPFGMAFKVEGGEIPPVKFPRVSLSHGLSVFDHLDLWARPLGIKFTSDVEGAFVAAVGPSGTGDALIEGRNILEGRALIYNQAIANSAPTMGQGTGSDDRHGADVAHKPFATEAIVNFAGGTYMPFVIPSELPTSDRQLLLRRAQTERTWLADDQITIWATVTGWLQSDGRLWQRNANYSVNSPMLVMNGDVLTAKSVTFLQDDNDGTRTILELCNPLALSGGVPQMQ
jgi:prophage tail gpP-like protein